MRSKDPALWSDQKMKRILVGRFLSLIDLYATLPPSSFRHGQWHRQLLHCHARKHAGETSAVLLCHEIRTKALFDHTAILHDIDEIVWKNLR